MKTREQGVCPGCSRHCTAENVRCKRGCAYFAKLEKDAHTGNKAKQKHPEKKRKWEKDVAAGGLIWHLLSVSGGAKKALRRGYIREEQLLESLSEADREQLRCILKKLNRGVGKFADGVEFSAIEVYNR